MIEDAVRKAIVAELERQAKDQPDRLKVRTGEEGIEVDGEVRLDELVMAVLGAVAGGL